MSLTDTSDFIRSIRSEKELHLIVAALRYYGNAPHGDIASSLA